MRMRLSMRMRVSMRMRLRQGNFGISSRRHSEICSVAELTERKSDDHKLCSVLRCGHAHFRRGRRSYLFLPETRQILSPLLFLLSSPHLPFPFDPSPPLAPPNPAMSTATDIKEQIRQNILRRNGSISPIDKKPPDTMMAILSVSEPTKGTAQGASSNTSSNGGTPGTAKHKESPGLKISTTKHLHQNIVAGGQHSAPQQHPIAPRPSLHSNSTGPGSSSSAPNTPTDHHASTQLSPSLSQSGVVVARSDSLNSTSSQLSVPYETKNGHDYYVPAQSFSFEVETRWFYEHVIADYKSKSPADRWHKDANAAIYELVQTASQFPKWISIAIREKQCYWGVRPGPKSENGKRHWYVKFTCRPNCTNTYQLYGSHTSFEQVEPTMTVYLEFADSGQCCHKAGEKPRKRVKPNRRRGEGPFGSTGFKDDPASPTSSIASPTSPMSTLNTPLTPTSNKRALPPLNTSHLPMYGITSSPKKMRAASPPPLPQTPTTAGGVLTGPGDEEMLSSVVCTFIFNLFDSGKLEEHEAKLLSNLAVEKNAHLMTIYRGGLQQEDDEKRNRQFLFGVRAKFYQELQALKQESYATPS